MALQLARPLALLLELPLYLPLYLTLYPTLLLAVQAGPDPRFSTWIERTAGDGRRCAVVEELSAMLGSGLRLWVFKAGVMVVYVGLHGGAQFLQPHAKYGYGV